jgi:hypothetical protein
MSTEVFTPPVINKTPPVTDAIKPRVVVLSSSLLTDRMFRYTGFMRTLAENARPSIWAMSARKGEERQWGRDASVDVETFPQVRGFREYPYNYLRRLNEYVWDYYQKPPSRLSMTRHVKDKMVPWNIQVLKAPARVLAAARAHQVFEDQLEKLLLSYPRSVEAEKRFKTSRPDVVVTTGPFQYEQPAVASAAKTLGIPVMSLIPSWDNLSTKGRMVFKYDGYMVWSERSREELHYFYPASKDVPVYVVGASQFDVFYQDRFRRSRQEFAASLGLRADLPIVVYAVGSPNFLPGEKVGAIDMAERVDRGELGDVQLVVRPHPIHDNAEMVEAFRKFSSRIVLQHTAEAGTPLVARSQSETQIVDWVNTFYHADVVVNLASTVTVDAAIFDRPVVNIDYDPQPGQADQQLIREVNHEWTHFKPIAESGGVWLVNNPRETVEAIKGYLRNPAEHRAGRRWITEYVCGYVDGRSGERMAEAIVDFGRLHVNC